MGSLVGHLYPRLVRFALRAKKTNKRKIVTKKLKACVNIIVIVDPVFLFLFFFFFLNFDHFSALYILSLVIFVALVVVVIVDSCYLLLELDSESRCCALA